MTATSLGCGPRATEAAAPARPQAGYETVASPDPVTQQLTAPAATASVGEGPNWLRRLAEQDILTYLVQRGDERESATVELRVQRLVRRKAGVAALLVAQDESSEIVVRPHWLVGDETGLYRLDGFAEMPEPGFVPLDDEGHVLGSSSLEAVQWRVPAGWPTKEGTPDRQGWEVEELELVLEGPVQGQRCARIRHGQGDSATHITVCADLGMVETVRGDEQSPQESWRLARIRRAPPDP